MTQEELKNNFIRDRVFMTHGSLLNGYRGNPKNLEEYKKDARELFELAKELVSRIWDETHPEESQPEEQTEDINF